MDTLADPWTAHDQKHRSPYRPFPLDALEWGEGICVRLYALMRHGFSRKLNK
jgi:hypothetical protein